MAVELIVGDGRDGRLFEMFNGLALRTFNIYFEKWRALGFWNGRFSHLSYLDAGSLVSNVSASRIGLIVEGRRVEACVLGTVMTAESHRGRGLATALLREAMERQMASGCEIFILVAGQARAGFYGRLGFQAAGQTRFSCRFASVADVVPSRLDLRSELGVTALRRILDSYSPQSGHFDVADAQHIFAFNALSFRSGDLYLLQEPEAVLSFTVNDGRLVFHGILCERPLKLKALLERIVPPCVAEVEFMFTPGDCEGLEMERAPEPCVGDVLMFKAASSGARLPEPFRFPEMFRA